jgi:sugar (pentulose or hexulose) kinase
MQPAILAIDNGTQSVRALLFDARGELLAKSQVPLDAYFSPQPGWAEHDVEEYWQAVCRACQGLWAQPGVSAASVAGVAVTTQRGTVVNLGADGQPLRPAITWLDQRRAGSVPPISALWQAAFKLARVDGTIDFLRGEAEINWIRQHQPEVYAATASSCCCPAT